MTARQQVNERLRGVDLPPGRRGKYRPNSTPVGEVMRYRLRGDGYPPPTFAPWRTGWLNGRCARSRALPTL